MASDISINKDSYATTSDNQASGLSQILSSTSTDFQKEITDIRNKMEETEKVEEVKMEKMLQKAVEHMEGKMKNMLDDYLHKNQPNLSNNQIKDVENEISQQLEQEVKKQFMSQSNQITKDLETEINDETEEGILNKLKDKIDSAGNNIKDSMGNMMESIEKKVLNKHGVNISEERKINNEQ